MASLDGSQSIYTSEVRAHLSPHGSSCLPQPLEGDLTVALLLFSLAIALFEVFSRACGSKIISHKCSAKPELYRGFFAPTARCCHGNGHRLSILCY